MPSDSVSRSFKLFALVERLQKSGFRVDTRQYLIAHELLLALANHGEALTEPERLISHLGPIFCTSAEEQERFASEVVQWLDPTTPPPALSTSSHKAQTSRKRRVWMPAALVVAAVLIALAAWVWPWPASLTTTPSATPIETPSPSADVVAAPPAIEEPPRTAWWLVAAGAVLLTGLAFGVAWLIDRGQRQLALRRLPTHDDPERVTLSVPEIPVRLVADSAVRRAAAALSRPREGAVLDLDIEATVDETARAGGFFSPRFSARRSAQEYIALVNRRSSDDHQAAVFDTFLKQLRDRGIALETYSFHDDPRVCYSDESGQGRRLSEIVSRHYQATLLVCGEAHLAFKGPVETLARWVDSTTPLERRVFWTPEAPYRWSHRERDLVEAGFTVIPATEQGWRALVDLENGWRQEALFPAPYARPFPGVIGANERQWLDRNEPPPDIVDNLMRQVTEFLGPAGFQWLCACAVYPEIAWGLTLRVAGDASDYSSLPSLSRLPWFRHGFMPDWLRRRLVSRLPRDAGDRLRRNLERLLGDLAQSSTASANAVIRSALHIGRWIGSTKTVQVLRAAPDGSPLRDQVFLGFMARANVDPLSLRVAGPLGRLFPGRVGRFESGLEFKPHTESLARQLLGRLRAWEVFHPERLRLAQSMAIGILLSMLWRPTQTSVPAIVTPSNAPNEIALTQPNTLPSPTTPTQVGTPGPTQTAVAAKPPGSETAKPSVLNRLEEERRIRAVLEQYEAGYDNLEAAAVRAIYPGAPADLAKTFAQVEFYRLELVVQAITLAPDATSATAICRLSHFFQPKGNRSQQYVRTEVFSLQKQGNNWAIVRMQPTPIQQATAQPPQQPASSKVRPETAGGGVTAPVDRVPTDAPNVNPAGRGGQPGPGGTVAQNSGSGSGAPADNLNQIRQLLENYSAALESLNPANVQALYPSVNTRVLRTAFDDYKSLEQEIKIDRIDLGTDGLRATVVALVTTAPVVRTGRASPVTRTVTFALRKQGDTWLIESAK